MDGETLYVFDVTLKPILAKHMPNALKFSVVAPEMREAINLALGLAFKHGEGRIAYHVTEVKLYAKVGA